MNHVKWVKTCALTGAVILGGSLKAMEQDIPRPDKPNVVLIVLDQLRAGQLHCYGNARDTSPNIDRLAARGVRFSHYYTVASWTAPSFSSLHTSLYASRHGVTLFWQPGMPLINKDVPMLAPDFKYHGYYTAAFVNNGERIIRSTGAMDEREHASGSGGAQALANLH